VEAKIMLTHGEQKAALFLQGGQIAHAKSGHLIGEEAVYQTLAWQTGNFVLERDIPPPTVSIHVDWNNLLLESLRRLDEYETGIPLAEVFPDALPIEHQERQTPKTRSEALRDALTTILEESFDIEGALVVSRDGLVMAAQLPAQLEDARVGAISAGVLNLGARSITQLACGEFSQILAEGSKGNIIVTEAGPKAAFVALTPQVVNLGMVFLEAREGAERIAYILD